MRGTIQIWARLRCLVYMQYGMWKGWRTVKWVVGRRLYFLAAYDPKTKKIVKVFWKEENGLEPGVEWVIQKFSSIAENSHKELA